MAAFPQPQMSLNPLTLSLLWHPPSLPTHSQFIPSTPFIYLAASSPKTIGSGSGSGCSYLLAPLKRSQQQRDAKKDLLFPGTLCYFCVPDSGRTNWSVEPLFPAGIFSLSGQLENKGATGCTNYLTTCFKLPLFYHQLLFKQLII